MSMRYPGGLIATSPVNARYPSGVWTQAQAIPYQAQNVWTRDQFWPYTTLLLQGDGAVNGAQNNTFLDSSSNNFTITRNGNTTQGSFTPYEPSGYWSNVGVPNGSNAITTTYPGLSGTGDYTVSFWIYLNSWTGGDNNGSDGGFVYIYGQGASHPTYPFAVRITKAGKVVVVDSVNFGPTWESTFDYAGSYNTANSISLNRWNYIHIVRSSGTLSIYANGGLQLSVSQASAMAAPYTNGTINDGNGFDGYISNFRIATTAITNATPPTEPSSASGAVLLTCASNRFQDLTGTYTVTPSGSASVQAFQPFPGATTYSGTVLGGSGYFDGSGDFLNYTDSSQLNFGTGSYTIEFWIYGPSNNDNFILGNNNTSTIQITTGGSASTVGALRYVAGGNVTTSGSVLITDNAWHHCAIVRNGSSNVTLYVDGVSVGTGTDSTNYTSTTSTVTIAKHNSLSSNYLTGYLSNLRIVKGTAVYTSAFTPPAAPLTAISGTSLLLNFTNAGIYDNSMMNNLETVGNAQVSTSVVKYGTGSMAFDGSGDYLFAANNPGQRIMGGDFTVEMWMYLGAAQANMGLVSSYENNNGWIVRLDTTYIRFFYGISGSGTANDVTYSFSPGVWYHIAWVKSGTSLRCYINGTQQGSTFTVSGAVDTTTAGMQVGRTQTNTNDFNGYIDDLRITKGAARYITTFTPPPARLPAQ